MSLDDDTLTDLDAGSTSATEWEPVAATLECLQGTDRGRLHVLYSHGAVLGRGRDCDLRLTDRTVSRRHAVVSRVGNHYTLEDLDSGNHTFLDGEQVTSTVTLPRNCRIRLGKHTAIDFAMVDDIALEEVYERMHGDRCLQMAQDHSDKVSRQADELRAMVRDLDLFTRSAAHDLRSPLQGLLLNLHLLADQGPVQDDPDTNETVQEALGTIERMSTLLRDLTAYARVRRVEVVHGVVDMNAVVNDALANLRVPIDREGARIRVEPLPREVVGNRSLLTLLVQNLVANAVKFHGGRPPRVKISSTPANSGWVISVQDHGIGLPEDRVADVFKPFERLQARGAYEGSGLGLAIAERIVHCTMARSGWTPQRAGVRRSRCGCPTGRTATRRPCPPWTRTIDVSVDGRIRCYPAGPAGP